MFLDTESEASSIGEVDFSQFSVLDFETSLQDLIGFISSDSDVHGHFLVSLDTEGSDSESGSGWDWFLSG